MKESKFDGISIYETDIYEFQFDTFYLKFDGQMWFVEAFDEDLYDEIEIIESEKEGIKFQEERSFFGSQHKITLEMFNKYKEIVEKEIKIV